MSRLILVVDDDQDILVTIEDILDAEGFPVRVARNGMEALELTEEASPALIVLDLWMPVMTGQELVARLRQRGDSTPILVMTAVQAGNSIAQELGAEGYIPKPFDIDRLLNEIERILGDSAST